MIDRASAFQQPTEVAKEARLTGYIIIDYREDIEQGADSQAVTGERQCCNPCLSC